MIVTPEQSAHWYTRDGRPFYEVPCKSRPGELRKATKADARKIGAVPSVTTILKVVAKPGLEAWKAEQYVLSALTLPRPPGETDDDFARRVVADAREGAADAADLGTQIHAYIEQYHATGVLPVDDGSRPMDPRVPQILGGYSLWARKHIGGVRCQERVFANVALGYGGRIDLEGTTVDGAGVVVDFKTQGTKQGRKINVYPEWAMQLAAYAAPKRSGTQLWIVVVSTTEMGRVELVDVTAGYGRAMDAFGNAQALWCYLNDYDAAKWTGDGDD